MYGWPMSILSKCRYECPKCCNTERTRYNIWDDNYAEIYCDVCAQHFASEDHGEPFEPIEEPRHDCRDMIVRQLLQGNSNPFEHDEDPL